MLISIPVMLTKTRNVGVQTKDEEAAESVAKVHNAVAKRTESESCHDSLERKNAAAYPLSL